jgi:SAM-dependent methyltransferase
MNCRLCGTSRVSVVFKMTQAGQVYTIVDCAACQVLQTLEQHERVSPDYLGLTREEIDGGRVWCQGAHKSPAFLQWAKSFEKLGCKNAGPLRLMDIGCGTGGFLRFARAYGMEVYGFDASEAQAEFAKREHPNVRQAASPSEYVASLGDPEIRFDLATLWDVLEHLRCPAEYLASLRRILKPGGMLYVSTPNGRAMLWKHKVFSIFDPEWGRKWVPWEHVFYFSMPSLISYLRRAGFDVVRTGAVACYPRPLSPFELLRRVGFAFLGNVPSLAPQIYAWARCPS